MSVTEARRRLMVAVVLDTSVVKTKGTEFVALDVKRLINTTYEHLDVRWQVPRVVVLERQQQMATDALALLKHRGHLEFLMQQELAALSAGGIEARLATFIGEQLDALRLQVLELDARAVGWDALIEDAVRRAGHRDSRGSGKRLRWVHG